MGEPNKRKAIGLNVQRGLRRVAQLAPGTAGIGFHERAIAGSSVLSTITKAKRSHMTAMLCFQLFPLLRCLSWCQAWREVPSTEAVLDFNAVLSLSCLLG